MAETETQDQPNQAPTLRGKLYFRLILGAAAAAGILGIGLGTGIGYRFGKDTGYEMEKTGYEKAKTEVTAQFQSAQGESQQKIAKLQSSVSTLQERIAKLDGTQEKQLLHQAQERVKAKVKAGPDKPYHFVFLNEQDSVGARNLLNYLHGVGVKENQIVALNILADKVDGLDGVIGSKGYEFIQEFMQMKEEDLKSLFGTENLDKKLQQQRPDLYGKYFK